MKTFKKILALTLSLLMVMAILAGCGPKKVKRAEEPLGKDLTKEEKFKETVTLTWCFPDARGAGDFIEWERIVNAINEITLREINTKINIEVIPLGEYTEKMSLKYAANERWDVAFCGTQWNPYSNAVSQKVLEPLTQDYLETYMPETMATMNAKYFDALTIGGGLYGIPLQQIYVRQNGIRFELDWFEELNVDWETIEATIDPNTPLESLEVFFDYLLMNNYNECFFGADDKLMENTSSYMGFDTLISTNFPGAIRVSDGTCTVINQYETPEFKHIAGLMQKWHDAGYFSDAALNGGQANSYYELEYGESRHPVGLEPVVKPGGDAIASMKAQYGITIKTIPIGNAVLTTSSVAQTAMVVSRNSEYPGRAMAFIELLNTNEELLNLICYGQEGVDWTWEDEENKVMNLDDSAYPGNEPFFVGNTFLSYYVDSSMIGCWEETKQINDNAELSPLYGFTFDASPVRNQMAAINANLDAHLEPVLCGMGEGGLDAGIASLNQYLYDNGLQDILDEMQRQVNEWLAAKQ